MAVVSSNGCAHSLELLLQSVTLVDLNYSESELLPVARGGELADLVPRYDKRLRQLWLGGFLLKTIIRPRTNQELILAAFDEEDWPESIDDPLPPVIDLEPRKRLRDTLFALNRAIAQQADPRAPDLLEFHAENSGEAIRRKTIANAQGKATLPLALWRPATAPGPAAYRPRRCK